MEYRIDAELLKQEACASKKQGKPTDTFGIIILELTEGISRQYVCPHPEDRQDAISSAVVRCLLAVEKTHCSWKSSKVGGFFSSVARNAIIDFHRDNTRRMNRLEPLYDS